MSVILTAVKSWFSIPYQPLPSQDPEEAAQDWDDVTTARANFQSKQEIKDYAKKLFDGLQKVPVTPESGKIIYKRLVSEAKKGYILRKKILAHLRGFEQNQPPASRKVLGEIYWAVIFVNPNDCLFGETARQADIPASSQVENSSQGK